MATRTSFRPRPLDITKQLAIVRDIEDLDSTDGLVQRDVTHNHEALDKENEEAMMVQSAKAKGGKEIPIPQVKDVPTYCLEYLPTFREQPTYIRGRGGVGYRDERRVEYDLDQEDEQWLEKTINRGQDRLPPARLELLLWRLELANAEATDRALAAAGAASAERQSPAAAAATDHMTPEEGRAALDAAAPLRAPVREAVLEYWRAKRAARGRPLLRRLQAPTSASDTNPFNVFRPRERIHRPQTRRRRENNADSAEKLRAIRGNLTRALELLEALVRREHKKAQLACVETDLQQLQLKQRHEPRGAAEALEAEYYAAAKAKAARRPVGFEPRGAAPGGAGGSDGVASITEGVAISGSDPARRLKKRRKDGRRQPVSLAALPPPPPPPPPDMDFAAEPRLERLPGRAGLLAAPAGPHRWRARIGRGGRLMFDRADWRTLLPLGPPPEEGMRPLHKLPNPYAAYAGNQIEMPWSGAQPAARSQSKPPSVPLGSKATQPAAMAMPAPAPALGPAAVSAAGSRAHTAPGAVPVGAPPEIVGGGAPNSGEATPAAGPTEGNGPKRGAAEEDGDGRPPKRGPGRPPKNSAAPKGGAYAAHIGNGAPLVASMEIS